MRRTFRWLGCAALLCCTAIEFSGCSSARSLVSGLKLPGRRDKSSAVASKDTKPSAAESTDLLAQARAYEKAGDFPKAARTYREYLDGGGKPVEADRRTPTQSVAKTKQKSAPKGSDDQSPSSDETRSAGGTQLASKSTKRRSPEIDTEETRTAQVSGTAEDPWASDSADSVTPSASKSPRPTVVDAESTDEPLETPETTLASNESTEPSPGGSPEALEDLLDLDEGKIDWGDESEPSETATAATETDLDSTEPVGAEAAESSLVDSETPAASDEMESPVVESEARDQDWQSPASDAPAEDSTWADTDPSALAQRDEFAPPIAGEEHPSDLPDAEGEVGHFIEPVRQSRSVQGTPVALQCKDCEPWIYAQVMKLESPNAEIRKEGLNHLAEMGQTARPAGGAVRKTLQDPNALVQAHAAWALWQIEQDPWESVGTLTPLLDNSNADVVELACYMLGDIGAPADSAVDGLVLLRDHAQGTMKVQAAEALIRIRGIDDQSVQVLTTALKSKDSQERWIAAVALGRCRGDQSGESVSALTAALKDHDPEVRSAAALSLGGFGEEAAKAKPELQRIASSDNSQVREAALAALACLKL